MKPTTYRVHTASSYHSQTPRASFKYSDFVQLNNAMWASIFFVVCKQNSGVTKRVVEQHFSVSH